MVKSRCATYITGGMQPFHETYQKIGRRFMPPKFLVQEMKMNEGIRVTQQSLYSIESARSCTDRQS